MSIIVNLAIERGIYAPDNSTNFPSIFEIDYIRYYKQLPNDGNVNITDISQLNLNNGVFNVIIGSTITIGGNVTITSGKQLELVAKEEITFLPGFHAEEGSNFVARIDPSIIPNNALIVNTNDSLFSDSLNVALNSNRSIIIITEIDNIEIKVYHENENLSIDFSNIDSQNFQLILSDEHGMNVFSIGTLTENKIDIITTGFNKGSYVLKILDLKNKNAYLNKITIQ